MPIRETMPWERGGGFVADMFGLIDEDPAIRRARELEHDRAIASAEFEARRRDPRAWETTKSIGAELFNPLAQLFGAEASLIPRSGRSTAVSRDPSPIHAGAGSNILQRNPMTGEMEVLWSAPDNTPTKLKTAKLADLRTQRNALIRSRPGLGQDASEWSAQLKQVQDDIGKLESEMEAPAPAQPEPSRRQPLGVGFIGTPGGENLFDNPFERGLKMGGADSTPTKVKRYRFNPETGKIE